MNVSINCKLSLSKKIRSLIGKEATLTLVSQDIIDGKGTAILSLSSDSLFDVNPEEMGETSIMIIPVETAQGTPNDQSMICSNIFSDISNHDETKQIIKKVAVICAPEKGQEATAIKEKTEIPKSFSDLNNDECLRWINNMKEFIEVAGLIKNKKSSIDLESVQNKREKAVLMEKKEKEESIGIPAWIVNDKVGMLFINDLDISLPFNSPYDLGNISAKRVVASKDLKILLRENFVRFISPEERQQYVSGAVNEEERSSGLEIFDHHDQAIDNMNVIKESNLVIDDSKSMEIDEKDILEPHTEEENMILNLTQNMPTKKVPVVSSEIKKTIHGSAKEEVTPKPSMKTVKRSE